MTPPFTPAGSQTASAGRSALGAETGVDTTFASAAGLPKTTTSCVTGHTYDWLERDGFDRPRDFVSTFPRRSRGAGRMPVKLQRRWSIGVAALAAVALPAFAAPGSWDRFIIADAVSSDHTVAPMPFEQTGASFPGSAFYYLSDDSVPLKVGEGIRSDADDVVSGPTLGAGPVARSMRIDNSGVDRSRAVQCLTAAIYYEAASEADAGQRAVAQVVLNRVAHPSYPNTVCGVVYQGSERNTGCQFSFTCDGALARRPQRLFWERAENVARMALAGFVYAPVGLATHYHTVQVNPYWAPSLHYLGTIGAHRFYSFKGSAGNPATFRFAYLGGEPMAAPHRRDNSAAAAAAAAALDPLAVQRAFDHNGASTAKMVPTGGIDSVTSVGGNSNSATSIPVYSSPVYSTKAQENGGDAQYQAQSLPGANAVKPEYANSGRWIATP